MCPLFIMFVYHVDLHATWCVFSFIRSSASICRLWICKGIFMFNLQFIAVLKSFPICFPWTKERRLIPILLNSKLYSAWRYLLDTNYTEIEKVENFSVICKAICLWAIKKWSIICIVLNSPLPFDVISSEFQCVFCIVVTVCYETLTKDVISVGL